MHNTLALTDRAIVAFLEASGITAPVYAFKRSLEKALPCVIVHSKRGNPIAPFGAVLEIECDVIIRYDANVIYGEDSTNPLAQNDSLVTAVMSALHQFGDGEQSGGELSDAITEAARAAGVEPYTCQSIGIQSVETAIEQGGDSTAWSDIITLTIAACPSDVS